jgi:hypothetical protein
MAKANAGNKIKILGPRKNPHNNMASSSVPLTHLFNYTSPPYPEQGKPGEKDDQDSSNCPSSYIGKPIEQARLAGKDEYLMKLIARGIECGKRERPEQPARKRQRFPDEKKEAAKLQKMDQLIAAGDR